MKALEIEAIVQKKGNKILIELPESAEYLVNQKVKLALIDKSVCIDCKMCVRTLSLW